MSNLSFADKQYLENALRLDTGFVLNFTDATFKDFFAEFGINNDDPKYAGNGTSKAKKMRAFWKIENNQTVGKVIIELAAMYRNQELRLQPLVKFSTEIEKIGHKLMMYDDVEQAMPKRKQRNDELKIELRPEIHNHVKTYLNNEDYFHAVEEGYKIVRRKLRELTGKEKATEAFAESNYEKIFGHLPENPIEQDFFTGIKFLNMAIQYFRNEKAHDIAKPLNRYLALHYLALTSLAYDLITRNEEDKD